MRITFATDMGESYSVEIDPQMEIENIMALLEAEVRLDLDLANSGLSWPFVVSQADGDLVI